MEEVVKAYAAGIIDGEGTVTITRKVRRGHPKSISHWMNVSFDMTTPLIPEFFVNNFGGYSFPRKMLPSGKSVWGWRVYGQEASIFLHLILPYLILKKENALIAIDFQNSWVSQKERGRKGILPEVLEVREEFYSKIKSLNSNKGSRSSH